jgi:serine/threonine protein kinase
VSFIIFSNGPNGTFGFSAPEVRIIPDGVLPRYTHKADIWSIGAILYWINYRHAPKYDYYDNSFRPPSGISSCKDRNVVDILQHTLRMNPHQRSETNWLARHPFIRSA